MTVGDKNIAEVTEMSIRDLQQFMQSLTLTKRQQTIGELVLREIHARVGFLMDVGLDYLEFGPQCGYVVRR